MIKPMLCEDGDVSDLKRPGFAGEWKWDGTRVFVIKENGQVTLQNRHGIIYTRRLPEVVEAAKHIPVNNFVIDAEVVYINPKTEKEEFTPCQRRCSTQDWAKILYLKRKYPITVEAFDLLYVDGDWKATLNPWLKRKSLLADLLDGYEGTIQYVQHRFDLEDYWEEVKQREGEGLILKDITSRYEHERSYKWLKLKNWRFQICDVVGWTAGKNARAWAFGSLVLAKEGKCVGCAGGGFNDWELRQVKDILADAQKIAKPFSIGEPYTAIETNLKVLVKYYQITENGVMRFPVFEKIVA